MDGRLSLTIKIMNEHPVKNSRIQTKWFNSLLESLDTVENTGELFNIVIEAKEQFGFNSIAYGLVAPNHFRSEIYYIYSDESEEWKQSYIQNEYWKIDSRIIMARKRITPFHWGLLPGLSDFISKEIMKGTWEGMTVPVHGPNLFFGFFHFTYCPKQKKINSWLQYIQPFIVYFAQRILETKSALIRKELQIPLLYNFTESSSVPLNIQQRKCLAWAAEGKTTEEIALILNLSVSTVNKHFDSASVILNANNRTHAIAKAINGNLFALEYKKKSTIFYF